VVALALMGIATVGMVLTPPFSAIGMLAPVLAIMLRLIQGFAVGGEVGPNTAYLLEAAPSGRAGLYISFQYVTQEVAILAAGIVGLVLSAVLSAHQLDAWGWRIAFAVGGMIIPVGLALRYRLVETLGPDTSNVTVGPASQAARSQWTVIVAGVLLIGAGTATHYTLDYLTIFAQTILHLSATSAFGSALVLGLSGIVGSLAGGILSDRYGRKRVMIGPWLALMGMAAPMFLLLTKLHNFWSLAVVTVLLSTLLSLSAVPALILITEALPQRVRAGALGITYALAISLFGGSAQFVETLLVRVTGSPLAPAWYISAALAVGLLGIAMVREQPPSSRMKIGEPAWS
jgi:MFS family permease